MPPSITFALFFGNRGFFPASLIAGARDELSRLLQGWGYGVLMMDDAATRYGAVETTQEGQVYAEFLRQNRGKYHGVIVSLPNFGDETGAVAALRDADAPILIQAYPDELDKMGPALRRDAFCGKLSIMDVFSQYGVKFTALKPHVVAPDSPAFRAQVDHFARVCSVVQGMKRTTVGAIGARTTPFKTVRIDELTLQKRGITVETLDMADVIGRVKALSPASDAYREKMAFLQGYADWQGVPEPAVDNLVRLGVVLDNVIREYQMDAIAIRCWLELQQQLGISPCVLLGALNNAGLPGACEVDTGNAIMMRALYLASGRPTALLDWNNNYGDAEDKCILFHCGPAPASLMQDRGRVSDHLILLSSIGEGRGYGCHTGRLLPFDFTFGGLLTAQGNLNVYLGQGKFTGEPLPADFFGVAGVAQIPKLQDVLLHIGRTGHRHHVGLTPGQVQEPLREALGYYLGYEVGLPQNGCCCQGDCNGC